MADDGYVSWYQSKLWNLLPAIYRNQDSVAPGVTGPLQELFNRLGAETATLRRSIDRLWENQSIETCDDWVIPYIGDLLATRLVACLDASQQRVDVHKTIYYRRRAGTLGLLEELTFDISRRDARAVEFFRRLGRTRHQFDPPIDNPFFVDAPAWTAQTTYAPGAIVAAGGNAAAGDNIYVCAAGGVSGDSGGPTGGGSAISDGGVTWSYSGPASSRAPSVVEGLAGANSLTAAGGFADLRNAYAAGNTNTAFDEFAHFADLRAGAQSFGWQNISHLGVFIWWLKTFQSIGSTPVSNGATPPCFTFDPSGRQIQLFAPQSRTSASYGDDWVAPDAWDVPAAINETLWNAFPDEFYPSGSQSFADLSLAVGLGGGGSPSLSPRNQLNIQPAKGLFKFVGGAPQGEIVVQYHFALMSAVGAGAFPLSQLTPVAMPTPTLPVVGGGVALSTALTKSGGSGVVQIMDSLTYSALDPTLSVGAGALAIVALSGQRPMTRWTAAGATWTIDGGGGDLILQGIWLQGADIVLTGTFNSVTLGFMTLDPGTLGEVAIDGLNLTPVRLWIEAAILTLSFERCVVGPIATRNSGTVDTLSASDSILQAIEAGDTALFTEFGDVSLERCTVLGQSHVHRIDASETIFDDVVIAEDSQHGCVRFSAIPARSQVHQPYRCVSTPPVGPLFFSRRFGDPNYARLYRTADQAIIDPRVGDTILGGAQNGAEMGAFQSEGETLTKRGLVQKFEEYAPLGVFPVWIDAD
jgi:hypothetical protein